MTEIQLRFYRSVSVMSREAFDPFLRYLLLIKALLRFAYLYVELPKFVYIGVCRENTGTSISFDFCLQQSGC